MEFTIDDLLADHNSAHTQLQMDCFITLKSGVTPFGMYRQALRELDHRVGSLTTLFERLELLRIEIDELAHRAQRDEDPYERQRAAIRLQARQVEQFRLRRKGEDRAREMGHFYAQCCALKRQLGPLDDARRHELEGEMWLAQFKRDAAFRFMSGARALEPGLLRAMHALPDPWRGRALAAILDPTQLCSDVQQVRLPALPEPDPVDVLTEAGVRRLLLEPHIHEEPGRIGHPADEASGVAVAGGSEGGGPSPVH